MPEAPFTIFVPEPFPASAYEVIAGVARVKEGRWERRYEEAELIEALSDVHALVITSRERVTERVIEAAPKLRVIGKSGAKPSNVDLNAAQRRGVPVIWSPGANAVSVAETTILLLLAVVRRLRATMQHLVDGHWRDHSLLTWELAGCTGGLVGFGSVGREVARRLRAFDVRLLVHDPYTPDDAIAEVGAERVEFEILLREADFVSVHCELNEETRHLIGERELMAMKARAVLVNTARGAIVDEAAMITALRENWIGGAGVDVFEIEPLSADHPLLVLPNVVATPHVAAFTAEAIERETCWVMEDVRELLLGRQPVHWHAGA